MNDQPKFPTTDKWYRYVGDENMNKLFDLPEGHTLVFKIPMHELQACKWQWYKTLQWLGKTHEYRLSMDMPRGTFNILRRPALSPAPVTGAVQGPPDSYQAAIGEKVPLLTGSQADLVRLTIQALNDTPEEDRSEAIRKCLAHPQTMSFIKEGVRKHFGMPKDPSPTSTDMGERELDEDFVDSLTGREDDAD